MTAIAGLCALTASLAAWRAASHTVEVLRSTGPVWADRRCVSNPRVVAFLICSVVVAAASMGQPVWALLSAATVFFALVDLDTHSVPIAHARLAAGAAFLLLAVTSKWTGASPIEMAVSAGLAWTVMKVLDVVSRGDLGAGDVTLAPLIGIHAGWADWTGAVAALAVAFVIAGAVAGAVAVVRRGGRHVHLPLAPFLFVGTWVVVLR